MVGRVKSTICKTKGCNELPKAGSKHCTKHYFPRNTPEEQLVIPNLLKGLYNKYRKNDEVRAADGLIHISSVNLCMREKVFQNLRPEPLTPRKLKWFSNGTAIHHKVQSLMEEFPGRYKLEMEVKKGNIVAHIDLYDQELQLPIELKSLSSAGEEAPKNFHVDQLKMYMALTDSERGVVFYDPLLDFSDEGFSEWTIKMTKDERIKLREVIENKAALYALAMNRKDPSIATHINYDPEYNWHCEYCQYAGECADMRANDPLPMRVALAQEAVRA